MVLGPDKIKAKVFRDSLEVVLGPITEVINCSFRTTIFPPDWKTAEVIPLLREGDHEEPSKNRPLSLLNFASKVCEKIALEQFSAYLVSHNRRSFHQSGNKSLHSTETLNIHTIDLTQEAIDKKKTSALILLDLSKTFDSINVCFRNFLPSVLHLLQSVGSKAIWLVGCSQYASTHSCQIRL